MNFINIQAYATYEIRQDQVNDYLTSLLKLTRFFAIPAFDPKLLRLLINGVTDMILHYVQRLKEKHGAQVVGIYH